MSENAIFYVYEHWRPDTNTCFYVGKGKGNRAYGMARRSEYHKKIQEKLKRDGYEINVKIISSNMSEKNAYDLEIDRIKFWRDQNVELCNFSLGGEGGRTGIKWSEEHKRKISQKLMGHPVSEEQKRKQSVSYKKSLTIEKLELLRKHGLERLDIFKKYQHLGPEKSSKKVKCLDDGLIFDSASSAARHYNSAKSAIIELCLGKKYRKTVNGRVFEYVGSV